MNILRPAILSLALSALATNAANVSLTLQDAVSRSITNARELKIAEQGIQKAKAQTSTVRTAYMPTLTGVGTYSYSDPVSHSNGRNTVPHHFYDAHLNATWLLYDFGRRDIDGQKAIHQETIATDHRDALRLSVENKTITTYVGIMYDNVAIQVQDSLLANLRAHQNNTVKRFASGSAVEFDTLKTSVRMASCQSQRLSIVNDRNRRLIQLRELLGLSSADSLQLAEFPISIALPPENLDSLLHLALESREEIKLVQALERSAQLNKDALDKVNAPSVVGYVNAGVKDGYNIPDHTTQDPFLNGTLGVQVNAPIWDGGRKKSQMSEANVTLAIARDSLQNVAQRIGQEVQIALEDLKASYAQILLYNATTQQSEETVKMAQARYESGSATNQDYLDAVAELSQTRLQQYQYKFRYYLSTVALLQALGQSIWVR